MIFRVIYRNGVVLHILNVSINAVTALGKGAESFDAPTMDFALQEIAAKGLKYTPPKITPIT